MDPVAWRARHDAFAVAARGLRRVAVEGRAAEALAPLAAALSVHMAYEEDVLWPRYAAVAPAEGPGSLAALRHDHALLEAALRRGGGPGVEAARWSRLEQILEHHDAREARYVLPALQALGVVVDLDEPMLAPAEPASDPPGASGHGWDAGLDALATGGRPDGVSPPAHPKAAAAWAKVWEGLARPGSRVERRDGRLDAIDAWLRLRWMAGQNLRPPERDPDEQADH